MTKTVKIGLLFAILTVLTRPTSVHAMTHDRLDDYMMDPDLLEWDNRQYEKEKEEYNPFELIKHQYDYFCPQEFENALDLAFDTYKHDVNATNADGDTVLHKILSEPNFQDKEILAEHLMRLGANINLQDHNGNTPLHLAIMQPKDVHECVVSDFIEHGANVTVVNKEGKTALDLAVANKYTLTPYLNRIADFYAVMNNKMSFKKYMVKHLDDEKKWNSTDNFALKFSISCSFMKKLYRRNCIPKGYLVMPSEIYETGKQKKPNFDFYRSLFSEVTCDVNYHYNIALAYDILATWPTLLAEKLTESKEEFPRSDNPALRDHITKLIKTKHALMGAVWLGKKQVTEKLYVGDVCNYKRDIVKDENDMDETARIPLDVINRIVRFIPYIEIGATK